MHCPKCRTDDTKVIDSRLADEGAAVRRRRTCAACQHRFTTYERIEEQPLMVVKSSGRREPFDHSKIVAGVAAACKGRPVSGEQIGALAVAVEDGLRLSGADISSSDVGVAVLDRLRDLDEVAYLRFVSVYRDFGGADDFRREVNLLTKHRRRATTD